MLHQVPSVVNPVQRNRKTYQHSVLHTSHPVVRISSIRNLRRLLVGVWQQLMATLLRPNSRQKPRRRGHHWGQCASLHHQVRCRRLLEASQWRETNDALFNKADLTFNLKLSSILCDTSGLPSLFFFYTQRSWGHSLDRQKSFV